MDSRFRGNDNIIIQSLEYSKTKSNFPLLIRGINDHKNTK
jgi:hypothetical protein